MSIASEIQALGDSIIRTHDGQMQFTLGDARKIYGCGKNYMAAELHDHGLLVKKVGQRKMVSAYDLAAMMLANRIAPIDNTKRVQHNKIAARCGR